MANEQFGPGGDKIPKGAAAVTLMGQGTPTLGQERIPARGNAGGAPAVPQRTAQLSPAQTPRGAQQVPLAGVSTPQQAPAQAAFVPARPQLAGAQALEGNDTHLIRVEGVGPDGRRYRAEFDAVFPRGTKITQLGEVQ